MSGRAEIMLLEKDGQTVADDHKWEEAAGQKPDEDRNYWDGTETTPKMMPGVWKQMSPAEVANFLKAIKP